MTSPTNDRPVNGASPKFSLTPMFILRNFEEIISCAGMCAIIIVVTLNVTLRYCFNRSISWAEEISVIGFSCVIFIGSAAVFKRHMHVGIDFVVANLPARVRSAIASATGVFVLFFNAYITYLGWIYSVESWAKPTSILFIPYFFVTIPICIGFASMTVHAALDLAARLRSRYDHGATQRFKEGDI